jgi:hypothetical protein
MLALLSVAGCPGNHHGGVDMAGALDMAPNCPNDYPMTCPSPAPTWDGGARPIIDGKCVPCHNPTGLAFDKPLTDYNKVYSLKQTVIDQIFSCYMPPPDAGVLDETERQTILGWFVCGAQQN